MYDACLQSQFRPNSDCSTPYVLFDCDQIVVNLTDSRGCKLEDEKCVCKTVEETYPTFSNEVCTDVFSVSSPRNDETGDTCYANAAVSTTSSSIMALLLVLCSAFVLS